MNLYYCPGHAASCTTNNGNVAAIWLTTPGVYQDFTYTDKVNRLTSIQEGANSQTWQYDNLGNRWVTSSANSGLPQSSFLPTAQSQYNAKNQLTNLVQGAQYSNDGRGNLTSIGVFSYSYDGENRMVTSTTTINSTQTTYSYSYDGDGRRVQRQTASGTITYVYDAFGNVAAEYGGTGVAPCATCYLSVDHLGGTRALTDALGAVKERHDYMPFGEELFSGVGGRTTAQQYLTDPTSETVTHLFTGKERDAETGLDFFGARYFSAAQGRFTSPDGVLIDQNPSDPQSWNLYAYVRNNPLRFIDPTGQACVSNGNGGWVDDNSGGQSCADVDKENQKLKPSATVTVSQDELNLMMLQSVGENLSSPRQWAEVAKNGMEGAMAVEGIRALPSAIRGGFNLFELWRATRLVPGSLEALAAAGGPTIEVVTSQTQALSATRGLSAAIGEGAAGVAKSFQPTGTLYTAKIPEALVRGLQSRGLAEVRSLPQGKELYFTQEAMQYLLRFFK